MSQTKLFVYFLPALFLLLLFMIAAFYFQTHLAVRLRLLPDHSLINLKLEGKNYQLEVVHQPSSLTLGLGRRHLDQVKGNGMIFVLPKKQIAHFWMKQMEFPLDFYWLVDQHLVAKTENVPAPPAGQLPATLPIIHSPVPVNLVVEIPAKQKH